MRELSNGRFVRTLERAITLLSEPMAIAAGLACAAAIILVVFEAINRYGQLSNLTIAEEYTGYLLVFISVFGAGSSFKEGLFPRLEFIVKYFPERLRELFTMLACVTGLFVNGVYMWSSWELFKESYRLKATSWTQLYTPLAIPQGYMVAGFALFEIFLLGITLKAALTVIAKR